ncbi:MAG: tandem-95 repeat protein, partial [Deltaproteobacteria bacterium]|nr:tandem-95 repeat protein [Deltaproteobacteria bacterium]
VTIKPVNDAPTPVADSVSTPFATAVRIPVLLNDYDIDEDVVAISSTDPTSSNGGTVTWDDNNTPGEPQDDTIVYTPASGFDGTDTFAYTVSDGNGGETTATVTVAVAADGAANQAPTAIAESSNTTQDAAVSIDVLSNDYDADGDALTLTVSTPDTSMGGTVTVNDNSTPADPTDDFIDYTPPAGFLGTDTFSYTVDDGNGASDTAIVTVQVRAGSADPVPTAVGDSAATPANTAVTVDVRANDLHPNAAEPLVLDAYSQGAHGTVSIDDNGTPADETDDVLLYTPDSGFEGNDTFTYTISDSNGDTATAAVSVAVLSSSP